MIWEGNRFTGILIQKLFHDTTRPAYFFLHFLSGLILSIMASIGLTYIFGVHFSNLPKEKLEISTKLAITYGTRVNLFLHVLNGILFIGNQLRKKQLEAEELKRINAQSELQNIKNQVNPHFLFNNLNVLSTLVMKEHPDANRFIEEFSKVYRHVLTSQQKELIPLQAELELIEPYIFLLKKRFPESIFIEINVPAIYFTFLIIPVAVQMLIENAIKHNIASTTKPLTIKLSVDNEERLTVSNILQLKAVDNSTGQIGLKNIAQRYKIITGRDIEIVQSDIHFSVYLPLIRAQHESDYF